MAGSLEACVHLGWNFGSFGNPTTNSACTLACVAFVLRTFGPTKSVSSGQEETSRKPEREVCMYGFHTDSVFRTSFPADLTVENTSLKHKAEDSLGSGFRIWEVVVCGVCVGTLTMKQPRPPFWTPRELGPRYTSCISMLQPFVLHHVENSPGLAAQPYQHTCLARRVSTVTVQ